MLQRTDTGISSGFRVWERSRWCHAVVLCLVWAVLSLPNLGGPDLWDMDEGLNSEAAQEMRESGNWIVPTFNYKLRDAKPALLYWAQLAAYEVFGVNEFGARFPSALAALLTILATYELGRRMFDPLIGLLAGVMLASAVFFCGSAHFANPDALLTAFFTLTLLAFWFDYAGGPTPSESSCPDYASEARHEHSWRSQGKGSTVGYILVGVFAALAVLAKGPVGVVLPSGAIWLFVLWRRQFWRLLDWRTLLVVVAFVIVALPWYLWVTLETKGAWLYGFIVKHHSHRVMTPLENHSGPPFYYLLALFVGLAPWSIFLIPTVWNVLSYLWKRSSPAPTSADSPEQSPTPAAHLEPEGGPRSALQFLLIWCVVVFLPFTVARTKLPNYVLPLYPALAILLAWFLERWRRAPSAALAGLASGARNEHTWRSQGKGEARADLLVLPAWVMQASLASLVLIGVSVAGGLVVASGQVPELALKKPRLQGLEWWAFVGVVPVLAGLLGMAWACWKGTSAQAEQRWRTGVVVTVALTSVVFTSVLAAGVVHAVARHRAPRALVDSLPPNHTYREIRVGAYDYFQPSLVFYCQREVTKLPTELHMREFLRSPLPTYVFVPARTWKKMQPRMALVPCRLVGRHYEMYKGQDIVVVSNR